MFVIRNLTLLLLQVIYFAANVFEVILIIRAVMSWFFHNPYNRFYQLLIQITEPVLSRVRRFLPAMSIDISAIIVILIIDFIIKGFILKTLFQFFVGM